MTIKPGFKVVDMCKGDVSDDRSLVPGQTPEAVQCLFCKKGHLHRTPDQQDHQFWKTLPPPFSMCDKL